MVSVPSQHRVKQTIIFNSVICPFIQSQTHPFLPYFLTSDVHLGHYRREGGERARKQKGREGERGLVFIKLIHPQSPSTSKLKLYLFPKNTITNFSVLETIYPQHLEVKANFYLQTLIKEMHTVLAKQTY